ncbi:MAG: hypothetical protein GC200_09800 [Tepidisphaera sp.]|nr:hypothetical protein [Tepidisphaera sp.]
MTDNTPNMNEMTFDNPADAALDAQLAILARMDGLAMPDGFETTLVKASVAAAKAAAAAPALRIAGEARVHDAGARVARTQRWHATAMKLAAGLVLVAGLATLARREGGSTGPNSGGTQVASTATAKPGGKAAQNANAGTSADTSDWAIVTAVLGDTPASDMRDLWTDTASLDERIKSGPSSSDLLTSEGSL